MTSGSQTSTVPPGARIQYGRDKRMCAPGKLEIRSLKSSLKTKLNTTPCASTVPPSNQFQCGRAQRATSPASRDLQKAEVHVSRTNFTAEVHRVGAMQMRRPFHLRPRHAFGRNVEKLNTKSPWRLGGGDQMLEQNLNTTAPAPHTQFRRIPKIFFGLVRVADRMGRGTSKVLLRRAIRPRGPHAPIFFLAVDC